MSTDAPDEPARSDELRAILPWSSLLIVRGQSEACLGVADMAGCAMHTLTSSDPMTATVFTDFMSTSILLQHPTPSKE